MGRAPQRLAILAAGVLLVGCSSPPPRIDGVLDCPPGGGIESFATTDLPGTPVPIAFDAARARLDGLRDDDVLVYADRSHPDLRVAARPGDLVVIRDGREVAWVSFIEVDGDWVAREGMHCPDVDIERRETP